MTLIAFATYGDHAELITDTMSYTAGARDVAQCTKHLTINHLDAVLATQGDSLFGIVAKNELLFASCLAPTFDDLAASTSEVLREAWDGLTQRDPDCTNLESSLYLIGFSTAADKFVAYRFLREHNFAAELVGDELHVTPSPLTTRPQAFELERLSAEGMPAEMATQWLARPQHPIPSDVGDWATLGLRVRYERAVPTHPAKVLVGGKLLHTRVERDSVMTMVLTEFDDAGDEFAQMVAGTRHPLAQHAPCPCGSGTTSLECCMLAMLDQDCGCGKADAEGKTFRECCMAASATD